MAAVPALSGATVTLVATLAFAHGGVDDGQSARDDAKILVTEHPTTVLVEIPQSVKAVAKRRLEHRSLKALRLTIVGLERPQNAAALKALRVFIDKPDATVETSIHDKHYVGSIVLGLDKKQGMVLNAAPAVSRLFAAKPNLLDRQTIPVTIVPVATGERSASPKNLEIPIESIRVELPPDNAR
jgi:hypothetical protein